MRIMTISLLFAAMTGIFMQPSIALAKGDVPPNASYAEMLKKVMPTVVNIKAIGELPAMALPFEEGQDVMPYGSPEGGKNAARLPRKFAMLGSGVILDAKSGYIVTNAHVVADANNISVTLHDGRIFRAKIIGLDKPTDIGVIQIEAKNLSEAQLGDPNKLQVGDPVVAIGSPFGLSQSVTSGIVSAMQRSSLHIEGFENFIQTDAPINPGNSGGALVDASGNLVGINTAILTPEVGNIGIGFAVPADMAKAVVEQLIHFGNVRRGFLGVMVQTLTPDIADGFKAGADKGAVVAQIIRFSPAEDAGIQVGDIIISIDGRAVPTADAVKNRVGLLRVGSTVSVEVLRHGKRMSFQMKTEDPELHTKEELAHNPYLFGLNLRNYSEQTSSFGMIDGVQVTAIKEGSPAWEVGLRQGDIIVSVNHKKIKSTEELRQIAEQSKEGILVNVLRDEGSFFKTIK